MIESLLWFLQMISVCLRTIPTEVCPSVRGPAPVGCPVNSLSVRKQILCVMLPRSGDIAVLVTSISLGSFQWLDEGLSAATADGKAADHLGALIYAIK